MMTDTERLLSWRDDLALCGLRLRSLAEDLATASRHEAASHPSAQRASSRMYSAGKLSRLAAEIADQASELLLQQENNP